MGVFPVKFFVSSFESLNSSVTDCNSMGNQASFFSSTEKYTFENFFDWFVKPPLWTDELKNVLLSPESNTRPIPDQNLEETIERSAKFPVKYPIDSVLCYQLVKNKIPEETLEKNINSTYPIIHEHALYLCAIFLLHHKKIGTEFYKNMSLVDLIDRLLSQRAVSFVGGLDHWLLLDGSSGASDWETIGTKNEKPPLILKNCLSYDEIKLAAFLSVSSHTVFVNDGRRTNRGVFEEDRTKIEENGVIIGLIGPRLPKKNVMEYQEVMKTKEQNRKELGYGRDSLQSKFLEFYGDESATYDVILKKIKTNNDRYVEILPDHFFDKLVYIRRIILSIDTLLIEANARAKNENKMAYVHVVGLGLGVWKIYEEQDKIFMDTFAKRLELLSEHLTHISDIRFAYIKHKMAGEYKDGDCINAIKIHITDKNPHEKLVGDDSGKLLVVSYAWDANALPGNEFWYGSLDTSSDPAAACSTQVAELHNWHVNGKVRGGNLRVATLEAGVVDFQEYQRLVNQ